MENRNILLIEDDPAIRESLCEVLETEGYSIVCAENGKIGIDLLETGMQPGLILVDIMMPIMDGYTFVSELRKRPSWSRYPVTLLSADGHLERKAKEQGITHYLKKPVELDDLLGHVSHRYIAN